MDRAARISSILQKAFKPSQLDVRDESGKHVGHAGAKPEGQTHYTLTVTAEVFRGKNRIERHRMINTLLEGEFHTGLHALAITAKAPGEN